MEDVQLMFERVSYSKSLENGYLHTDSHETSSKASRFRLHVHRSHPGITVVSSFPFAENWLLPIWIPAPLVLCTTWKVVFISMILARRKTKVRPLTCRLLVFLFVEKTGKWYAWFSTRTNYAEFDYRWFRSPVILDFVLFPFDGRVCFVDYSDTSKSIFPMC